MRAQRTRRESLDAKTADAHALERNGGAQREQLERKPLTLLYWAPIGPWAPPHHSAPPFVSAPKPRCALLKRSAHQRDCSTERLHDELSFKPKYAIPGASQRGIPAHIRRTPVGVALAVDLDDGPHTGRTEINDVQPEQWHLPPKLNAQPARTQRRPKPQRRARHHAPIRPSALLEPELLASVLSAFRSRMF